MTWQTIVAGFVSGVIFGALTAVGTFVVVCIMSAWYGALGFEGGRTLRLVKFITFVIFGILFAGLGGVFWPVAVGIMAAWGIGIDPSSPRAIDTVFYVGYFGTIAFYAVFGLGPLLKCRA